MENVREEYCQENEITMEGSRIDTFDILKGIGIILVIVCHTFMKEIGPFILTFHMPLFFIVAGYFFKYKPISEQIKKDFRRLIVPYLFIVISIAIIASIKCFRSTGEISFPLSTLYECGTPAWFLLALFGAKSLFNIVYGTAPQYYMPISFILSSIVCAITHFIDIDPVLAIGSSLCGVCFYAIGYFVKERNFLFIERSFTYKKLVFIVAVLFWLVTSIFGAVDLHYSIIKLWVIDILGACSGVYICYVISRYVEDRIILVKRVLVKIGYYSFVIYSFHSIEYVFPDWHQIASFSDGIAMRPFVILMFRFLFVWWAIFLTLRIPLLRKMFFPTKIIDNKGHCL